MARAKSAARREAIITSLLVIAGIVLAICLFAAGLFWRGKPTTKRAVLLIIAGIIASAFTNRVAQPISRTSISEG